MFYPILLSAIAGASFGVPVQAPDPTIRITLNNEGQYLPGDRAKVQVITRDDGYLVVFRVSPEGKLRVIFPLDPTDDNYVKGGKRYLLLGRGGREGFTVEGGGTGVIFAAVSLDPWRYSAYVENDHWNYGALNTVTYDDTETDLVNLAQAMASGRFDYDILGYTVASQQVAAVDEQVDMGASVGVIDNCFGCVGTPVGVVYGTGYYNTYGLYDPWYYSPYYNYGPYYPAWGYGPTWGWQWGWGCYGYYCNGSGYPPYYPPYPTAVPYSPYQKKSWDRTWNGSQPPYRPRGASTYTATNTVSGQLPGIGVQQHASFRDRTWANGTGGVVGGTPTAKPMTVPVSKTSKGATANGAANGATTTGGRRREAAPVSSSGSSSGSTAPMAVPSRPRSASQAAPTVQGGTSGRQSRPTAVPSTKVAPSTTTSSADDRRYKMPVEWTRPSPPPVSQAPAATPPVSRSASEAPAGTKATGEGRSSEPVLKRRDSDQPATATTPAPATRQDNNGQSGRTPDRGNSPPPSSQPSPGYSGGGSYGGSAGRAAPSQPSAPPSAVAGGGGGGRRR